jgi:hypothetical protein
VPSMQHPLNDERNVTLFLFQLVYLCLPRLILTSSIVTLLFHGRLNRMATDIGSLASGLDGRVTRLEIGDKGFRKNRKIMAEENIRCTPITTHCHLHISSTTSFIILCTIDFQYYCINQRPLFASLGHPHPHHLPTPGALIVIDLGSALILINLDSALTVIVWILR